MEWLRSECRIVSTLLRYRLREDTHVLSGTCTAPLDPAVHLLLLLLLLWPRRTLLGLLWRSCAGRRLHRRRACERIRMLSRRRRHAVRSLLLLLLLSLGLRRLGELAHGSEQAHLWAMY